jgi:hypothetical protein
MNKITIEQAAEWENNQIVDALMSGCFDDFRRYMNDELREACQEVTDNTDLLFLLDSCIESISTANYYCNDHLTIFTGEIEIQFEGSPENAFENVDDWLIDGDLAYCSHVGTTIKFNLNELSELIKDCNAV